MNGNFVLIDALPDASLVFKSSYSSISQIKDSCIVALDTNVMLAPYKLGASSFEKITEIYRQLAKKNRLVLPAHVAREYARQRTVELSKLVKALRDQSSRATSPINSVIPFLEKDSSYTDAKAASAKIDDEIKSARKLLDKIIADLSDPINGDPVLRAYSSIFSECIHDIKIEDRDVFEQNCDFRFSNNIPPGYQDEGKSNNAIGDVIIWKTIIDAANSRKSDVIFVTGDEKSDWWVRHDKTPFQPRYELIDEFSRETSGRTIHILPLHRFVEVFDGGAEAVEETERVERQFIEDRVVVKPPLFRYGKLHAELKFLYKKQSDLERMLISLSDNPSNEKRSLEIADQLSAIKRRIRSFERMIVAQDSGPNYNSSEAPDED